MSQSNYESVRQFTVESGTECPKGPTKMSKESVRFIIEMVLSEMQELALTVCDSKHEALCMLYRAVGKDANDHEPLHNETEVIAEQADAMVDAWYYMLNSAAKHGMDLSALFEVVHAANMAKKDPKTGKFIRRESDGKILKPEGWMPPNIVAEIEREIRVSKLGNGSYSTEEEYLKHRERVENDESESSTD